jgi:hypothetical protein
MSDLKNRILSAADRPVEEVHLPEWDATVEVRGLSAAARQRLAKQSKGDDGEIDTVKLSVLLVIATTHDPETHDAVFAPSDYDALADKAAIPVERLATIAARLSGMSDKAEADAGPPSSPDTNGSTAPSDSPSTSLSGSE